MCALNGVQKVTSGRLIMDRALLHAHGIHCVHEIVQAARKLLPKQQCSQWWSSHVMCTNVRLIQLNQLN